jgi:D-alanyl-D-alanine carboxypeptidase (penicillin-binding protein 5/6)
MESESQTMTTVAPETEAVTTDEPLVLPSLYAEHVFVYDVTEEKYLFKKATDAPIVPASISKLLASLCALHYVPKNHVIKPGDELKLVKPDSSIAYIKSHHKLTVEMLIEGMMLPSGNDAAYALAAGVARYVANDATMSGQDAIDYFLDLVNNYAVSIGCTGTHYVTPDGYAYEDHYNSVHDLVIIAKAAIQNEVISKHTAKASDYVTYASGHTNTWKNTNKLIQSDSPYYSPYVTGLKTGSLANNYCILVSAEIGGHTFIIGVFKAPEEDDRYEDATKILAALEAYMGVTAAG